jgi:hypothetical protein
VGLTNLGSESETCVGSRVHLVGVSISFEKNFYRLPFTPAPLWFAVSVLQVGSLIVFTVVVFVGVALVGKMAWFVLTPLSSKWLGTGFTLLVLTLVLSRLIAHVLVFLF